MAQPPLVKPEHCTAALYYLPSPAPKQHTHRNPKQFFIQYSSSVEKRDISSGTLKQYFTCSFHNEVFLELVTGGTTCFPFSSTFLGCPGKTKVSIIWC